MKPKTCRVVEQNLWRYIDRELPARQVSEISSHLKVCGDCSHRYEARAREASLYRLSFMDSPFGDEFAERFENRLLAEMADREDRREAAEVFTFNPPMEHRRVAVMASIAAIALVVVIGFLFRSPSTETPPEVADETAVDRPSDLAEAVGRILHGTDQPVKVVGEHGVERAVELEEISAGAHYALADPTENVVMALHDGTRLTFENPADWSFRVLPETNEDMFRGQLYRGALFADVVNRRNTGRRFEIETPNGLLRVLGTEFDLVVRLDNFGNRRTSIFVHEGVVEFFENGSEAPVRVREGDREFHFPMHLATSTDEGEEASPESPRPPPQKSADGLDQPVQLERD